MSKKTTVSDTNSYIYISVVLFSLSVLSFNILSSTNSFADNDTYVTTTNITVPVSCRLEGTVDTPHTASLPNGIYSVTYNDGSSTPYANGIGQTTLKAYCNDNEGFAISAIGYSNNEYGNTDLIATVGGTLAPTYNIHTGTATSGDTSNWAMKLTKVTGTYEPIIVGTTEDTEKQASTPNYTNYQAVPSTYTRIAYRNSATDPKIDANSIGSSLTTTYAAYISPNQPAGTYAGQVKYTLTHPASEEPAQPRATEAGKICYYANASSAVGTMGCQTIPASGGSATTVTPTSAVLLASNFSRAGYGFAGWSDAFDYATNENANLYGPQEYIEFTEGQYSGDNPGLSLYAVWVKSAGSLQDSTTVASVCSNLTQSGPNVPKTLNSVSALTDQRDNQTYAIAKLADGNCWMIENLRLEAENTRSTQDIALSQGYNTATFTGLADAENTNFSNSTATNFKNTNTPYYGADGSGAEIIISASDHTYNSTDYSDYYFPRYNNYNHQSTSANRPQNPTTNYDSNSTTNAGMYSYGNYYTWSAAIADTTFYRTNNESRTTTSLCPTGWRLPKGGNKTRIEANDDNEFWNLTVDGLNNSTTPANYSGSSIPYYTGTDEAGPVAKKLRSFPNNFLYSGFFYTSSDYGRGSDGVYWSSTAGNYYDSYSLYLYSSDVRPGTYNFSKYYGISIRCMQKSGA